MLSVEIRLQLSQCVEKTLKQKRALSAHGKAYASSLKSLLEAGNQYRHETPWMTMESPFETKPVHTISYSIHDKLEPVRRILPLTPVGFSTRI